MVRIIRGESIGLVAVDVEDTDQIASAIPDRQNQFGPRRAGAGDVACESFDIRHQLGLPRACGRAADTAGERDHEATVPALIGTDFQQFRFGDPVKAGPVKTVIGVVNLAGDGGHKGNAIRFACSQGLEGFGEGGVVNVHGVPFQRRGRGAVCPPDPPRILIHLEGLRAFDRDGRTFAATDADGRDAALEAPFFKCIQQCDDDPGT